MSTSQQTSCHCDEFRPHHLRPDTCRKCFGRRLGSAVQTDNQEATSDSVSNKTQDMTPLEVKVNDMTREQLVDELKKIESENRDLTRLIDEKDTRISSLETELEKLKSEFGKSDNTSNTCQQCTNLQDEMKVLKLKFEELELERDRAKEELKCLEHEMEEMHDNFKEEESEQFEQVKQELDITLKNCKILQIRLNKAERQYSQLEQVKTMLEKQLEDLTKQQPVNPLIPLGQDQQTLKQEQIISSNNQANFVQCGTNFVKLATGEYDQLLRDLNDTIERERDLQEQIKYSQEEAQLKGERLQAIEAENEVLLSKVNKLTTSNSKLRTTRGSSSEHQVSAKDQITLIGGSETGDIIEQNEQLKLALDLAQSECERLRAKVKDLNLNLESKEANIKEIKTERTRLEEELSRANLNGSDETGRRFTGEDQVSKFELECRQLRSKLVRSERECKQLKAQLEMGPQSPKTTSVGVRGPSGGNKLIEAIDLEFRYKQAENESQQYKAEKEELERKLEKIRENQGVGGTILEGDLLEKLKQQLEASENELAKTRSRLVELNLDYSQVQRKYKRLVESLESTASIDSQPLVRKTRLPPEPMRDPMSRQELRKAIRDLEEEIAEWLVVVKSKDCLLKEFHVIHTEKEAAETSAESQQQANAPEATSRNGEEEQQQQQVKSLRKTLEKQHSFIDNLKIDISNLEKENMELLTGNRMLERKCLAMEEEVEKLRQVNGELRAAIDDAKKSLKQANVRIRELQDKLKVTLESKQQIQSVQVLKPTGGELEKAASGSSVGSTSPGASPSDLFLLSRDLSELKVKNGFLMRQLELGREETQRQLEEQRQSLTVQQRRAVELAQLELKERQLSETQLLRDELNELKQKLVISQRQLARSEEEINGERDRLRSLERDWRRDNSQWTQRIEQLEAQMSIEKRSSEFKLKEAESQQRDKERELISLQDKYVQLERDLKRMQNKYNLLEENSESRQKQLTRELEIKKRELTDLIGRNQTREDEFYDTCKRFNNEKATLTEALESIKRSYDEKLLEIKSIRELLLLRQEQAFKERTSAQEKLDQLGSQLMKMSEFETQAKLTNHQIQVQEKQMETMKRELIQLKEDRLRWRTRGEEFERKCQQYEKRELINKSVSISPAAAAATAGNGHSSSSFLKSLHIGSSHATQAKVPDSKQADKATADTNQLADNDKAEMKNHYQMIEKLSSKINDQRNLINLLKQQHSEAQIELKQLKLLQSSERNKWQHRVTQLTSRLNECEEKLLFESSHLIGQEMFDNSKRRIESKWNEERQTNLNLLQQQQQQNEILMRDLKKLSQQHDLLRLQSKQLESQNNRLSRKLIEYNQQQQQQQPQNSNTLDLSNKLNDCLANKRDLELRGAQLEKLNRKLLKLIEEQTKPLVETVSKIVASIEAPASSSSDLKQQNSQESNNSDQQQQQQTQIVVNQPNNQVNSLHRPLVTSSNLLVKQTTPINQQDLIKSGEPAFQQNQTRSRLSRFLSPSSLSANITSSSQKKDDQNDAKKQVKKVRVKSSSLGITPSEKKQLKRHLEELSSAFGELSQESKALDKSKRSQDNPMNTFHQARASSEVTDRPLTNDQQQTGPLLNRSSRGVSYTPTRTLPPGGAGSGNDSPRVVHWTEPLGGMDQSDLDSERSWSMSQLEQTRHSANNQNLYSRFPSASTSSHYHASLTDYDSETSLASECSTYSVGAHHHYNNLASNNRSSSIFKSTSGKYSTGGAESDSCMQTNTSGVSSSTGSSGLLLAKGPKKKRGLKTRLTSTLRNISRSISGLASDSEASYDIGPGSSNNNRPIVDQDSDPKGRKKDGTVSEIRV